MHFSTGQFFLREREVHIFWGGAVECNVGNLHLASAYICSKTMLCEADRHHAKADLY